MNARHIAVLMPNVKKWWVAPQNTAIRQAAAIIPQMMLHAFMIMRF